MPSDAAPRLIAVALACACGAGCEPVVEARDAAPDGQDEVAAPWRDDGEACGAAEECTDGACLFGRCRQACANFPDCARGTSRERLCLYDGDRYHGGCSLPDELDCEDGGCADALVCDPNGVCRNRCAGDDECLGNNSPYCTAGRCYNLIDRGLALVGTGGGTLYSDDENVAIQLLAGALPEPAVCRVTSPDPAYASDGPYWSAAFGISCWRVSDDQAHKQIGVGRVTVPYSLIAIPAPFTVADVGVMSDAEKIFGVTVAVDDPAGTLTQQLDRLATAMQLTLVNTAHVTIDGEAQRCVQPATDRPTFVSGPWGPYCGDVAWSLYANLTGATAGTWDLADPATWDALNVSVWYQDTTHGYDGAGHGTFEGASGTVVVEPGLGVVRLEQAVLPPEDWFGAEVVIESAVLSAGVP